MKELKEVKEVQMQMCRDAEMQRCRDAEVQRCRCADCRCAEVSSRVTELQSCIAA